MRDELREKIAIAAMQGLLQRNDIFIGDVDAICRLSVTFADGLLRYLYNADKRTERDEIVGNAQQP